VKGSDPLDVGTTWAAGGGAAVPIGLSPLPEEMVFLKGTVSDEVLLTGDPSGGVPLAVPVFLMLPAFTSAWVVV
jgi:hypothetical protein